MVMIKNLGWKTMAGFIALALPDLLFAQQPAVGIGTQTPHPAAILHLAAPNNNQGLLLPRLTTVQLEAPSFKQTLDASAKGLTVFDTDRNGIYSWDGNAWKGTGGLTFPYSDSLVNGSNLSTMVRLQYKGNTGAAVGILALENRDPNNGFSPLYVFTNSVTQGAADIVVNSPNNNNDGIGVTYNGLGRAAAFRLNNINNEGAAVLISSNGKPLSVSLRAENTGEGSAIAGFSQGSNTGSTAVYGEHKGTGDAAGVFRITNAGNPYSPVYGETIGSGSSVYGNQLGTGRAGQFQIGNTTNTEAALRSFTNGLGRAGFFTISNADNTSAAIFAQTNGKGSAGNFEVNNTTSTVAALNATTNGTANSVAVRGQATNGGTGVAAFSNGNTFISPALYAEQSGTGDAAGVFKLTNQANVYNAVFGETVGSGSTFFALQKGTGRAGQFQINNPANNEAAVRGVTDGLGRAGFFTINNGANASDAIHAVTNGGGNSVFGQNTGNGSAAKFEISNTTNTKPAVEIFSKSSTANGLNVILEGGNTGDAIFAQKSTGIGSAGNFQNQNASNDASILFASTNAPGGTAIGAGNFANGNALAIWGGGLRLSTGTLSGGGNIANRHAAYEITGGSAYTITFPLSNGETFFFYNNTASPVTVNGISINANSGKTFIVLNNVLRGM